MGCGCSKILLILESILVCELSRVQMLVGGNCDFSETIKRFLQCLWLLIFLLLFLLFGIVTLSVTMLSKFSAILQTRLAALALKIKH